jgi:hypothetical protein
MTRRPSNDVPAELLADDGSPTRELIIGLRAEVHALRGAVRGLEERIPA